MPFLYLGSQFALIVFAVLMLRDAANDGLEGSVAVAFMLCLFLLRDFLRDLASVRIFVLEDTDDEDGIDPTSFQQ